MIVFFSDTNQHCKVRKLVMDSSAMSQIVAEGERSFPVEAAELNDQQDLDTEISKHRFCTALGKRAAGK